MRHLLPITAALILLVPLALWLAGTSRAQDDPAAPALSSAEINFVSLFLAYSEYLDEDSVPAAADFTVTVNGEMREISQVEVIRKGVELTLETLVEGGEVVTVSYTPGDNPILSYAGLPAEAITDLEAINHGQYHPPLVYGNRLIFSYNEDLDKNSVPDAADFTVAVNGEMREVSEVEIDDSSSVKLTLETPVEREDTVRVSYTPGDNPILRYYEGKFYPSPPLVDVLVINATFAPRLPPRTPVEVAPVLRNAIIYGDQLFLTYSDYLDEDSVPAAADFTVTVNGEMREISQVEVIRKSVRLLLESAVEGEDTVAVSYIPGDNPIRKAKDAEDVERAVLPVRSLMNERVENDTGRDQPSTAGDGGGGGCALASAGGNRSRSVQALLFAASGFFWPRILRPLYGRSDQSTDSTEGSF